MKGREGDEDCKQRGKHDQFGRIPHSLRRRCGAQGAGHGDLIHGGLSNVQDTRVSRSGLIQLGEEINGRFERDAAAVRRGKAHHEDADESPHLLARLIRGDEADLVSRPLCQDAQQARL